MVISKLPRTCLILSLRVVVSAFGIGRYASPLWEYLLPPSCQYNPDVVVPEASALCSKDWKFELRVTKRLNFPAFYTSHIDLLISIPCTPLLAAPRFLTVPLSLAISANPLHTPDPR